MLPRSRHGAPQTRERAIAPRSASPATTIAILACDARQARLAADAFERYGRGTGHPAHLNFGDCLAYAAAAAHPAPLLFKGEDFALTDLSRAG